jgi:hypothetical protein
LLSWKRSKNCYKVITVLRCPGWKKYGINFRNNLVQSRRPHCMTSSGSVLFSALTKLLSRN